MEDLMTADGKKSGFKCTRRLDTGEVLSPVTKDYGIVQNGVCIDKVRDTFSTRPDLGDYEESISILNGGRQMRARYTFKNHTIKIPKVGDELGLRLTVNNSFDRSLRVSFTMGMLRLVCLNGMTSIDEEFGLTRKHSAKFDVSFIQGALDSALDGFTAFGKEGNILTKMAETNVTQEQGLSILQNLTKKNVISEISREGIAQVWNNPRAEDKGRNVYNLLNASTDFITHQLEGGKYQLAERTTANVTRWMEKATKRRNVLETLWTPPKDDLALLK
jgi:hypothetical protein